MKRLSIIALILILHSSFFILRCTAQRFEDYFVNKTLRIDYTFSGTATEQHIAVDELCEFEGWYGKRQRLAEVPVEGNGQIIVRVHNSNKVIYRNSFSTLFQEWQSYGEAKEKARSFENVFIVPMPKDVVDVTIQLMNNRRKVTSSLTCTVDPNDILIRRLAAKGTTPYDVLQKAEKVDTCINIAFVAEGYQECEMDTFIKDAHIAVDALFQHEPFKSLRSRFNIVAVKSASVDSGTSEPSKDIWLNTALHSNFDTFYSDRYLTTLHIKDLHNILAGIPYEHIIVLVNTEKYGGGGILNSYNLSMTHNKYYRQVVVHEFGHSFAGLGDEYAYEQEQIPMYPHDIEPWEKNITTLVDFKDKWEGLINEKDWKDENGAWRFNNEPWNHDNGVPPIPETAKSKKSKKGKKPLTNDERIGLYEGAGYSLEGVYRACPDCRMRTNKNPEFCPACRKAITDLINFYTE